MLNTFIPLSGNFQRILSVSYGNNFKSFVAFGYSGFTGGLPVDNTNTAYIGYETGKLPYTVSAGSYATIDVPGKGRDNLSNLWIKGASGDGLFVIAY